MIWNPSEGINLGFFTIRFYSLMFVIAFGLGWYIMKNIFDREKEPLEKLLKVFEGEVLNAKDELSFNHSPINSQQDWENLLDRIWSEAEKFAELLEHLPEYLLWEDFTDKKYGIYYRNIHGIIEHTHYHLGQMVIIKKIIRQTNL